jgi:IS5 family transposase
LPVEEAPYDVPVYREFAGLNSGRTRLLDEGTILRFRHLLDAHGLAEQNPATCNEMLCQRRLILKTGSAVDVKLISAASSRKNASGRRNPEMHQKKKGDY